MVVAAAPVVNLLCALGLAMVNVFCHVPTLAAWIHSVHHDPEDNDPDNSRQTTTRHKPKTRLNSKDPRCMESGDETVLRMRQELKTKKKLAKEYDTWLVQIAAKFSFGPELIEKEIREWK